MTCGIVSCRGLLASKTAAGVCVDANDESRGIANTTHLALRDVEDRDDMREAAHVHGGARRARLRTAAELRDGPPQRLDLRRELLRREILHWRALACSAGMQSSELKTVAIYATDALSARTKRELAGELQVVTALQETGQRLQSVDAGECART